MQFTVWNAIQRLNGIKDNNVYNEIEKRVFNKSFLWLWKGRRNFYTISNHLVFSSSAASNKCIMKMKGHISFSFLNLILFYTYEFFCLHVCLFHHMCAVPMEVRREHWVPENCEAPCGGWDLNPGPLEGWRQALLTAEPPSRTLY